MGSIKFRTYAEAVGVLAVLIAIAIFSGSRLTDWTATLAVFLGFIHVQQSFKLAESLDKLRPSRASRSRFVRLLHCSKESVWIITFASLGSYPLVAGSVLFFLYPIWRSS